MTTPNEIMRLCLKKNLTISAAESCSGGYLSYLLSTPAGSSKIFKGSIIAYSLTSKKTFFGIPLESSQKSQGVSEKITETLAKKVKTKFKTDIGLAITGFAGPDALTKSSIGIVYLSISYKTKIITQKLKINGTRMTVRKKACYNILNLLKKEILC